jgi:hypothetical protein
MSGRGLNFGRNQGQGANRTNNGNANYNALANNGNNLNSIINQIEGLGINGNNKLNKLNPENRRKLDRYTLVYLNNNEREKVNNYISSNNNLTVSQYKKYISNVIKNSLIQKVKNNRGETFGNGNIKSIIKKNTNNVLYNRTINTFGNNITYRDNKKLYIARLFERLRKGDKKIKIIYEVTRIKVPRLYEHLKEKKHFNKFIEKMKFNIKGNGEEVKCSYNFRKPLEIFDFLFLIWLDTFHDFKRGKAVKNLITYPSFKTYLKKMKLMNTNIENIINFFTSGGGRSFLLNLLLEQGLIELNNNDVKITGKKPTELESLLKKNIVSFINNHEYKMKLTNKPARFSAQGQGKQKKTKDTKFYMILDQESHQFISVDGGFNNLETVATLIDPGRFVKTSPNAPDAEKEIAYSIASGQNRRIINFYYFKNFDITLKIDKITKNIKLGFKDPPLGINNVTSTTKLPTNIYLKTNWLSNNITNVDIGGTAKNINMNNLQSVLSKLLGDFNQGLTMSMNNVPKNYYQASEDVVHVYKVMMLYANNNSSSYLPRIMTVYGGRPKFIVGSSTSNIERNVTRYNRYNNVSITTIKNNTMTSMNALHSIFKLIPDKFHKEANYKNAKNVINRKNIDPVKSRKILIKYLKSLFVNNRGIIKTHKIWINDTNTINQQIKKNEEVYKTIYKRINKTGMIKYNKSKLRKSLMYIMNYPSNQLL